MGRHTLIPCSSGARARCQVPDGAHGSSPSSGQVGADVRQSHTGNCRVGLWPDLTSGGACRARSKLAGARCRLCQSLRAPGLGRACCLSSASTLCPGSPLQSCPFPHTHHAPSSHPHLCRAFPPPSTPGSCRLPPMNQQAGAQVSTAQVPPSEGMAPLCMRRGRQAGARCLDGPAAQGRGLSVLPEDDHSQRPQTALVTLPDCACVPGAGSLWWMPPSWEDRSVPHPSLPLTPSLLPFAA